MTTDDPIHAEAPTTPPAARARRRPRLSLCKRLLFLGVLGLPAVSVCEVGLRMSGFLHLKYVLVFRSVLLNTLEPCDDPELHWRHRPGTEYEYAGDFRASINRFGLREGPFPEHKGPDERFVLCLGDSFTFGIGQNDPYPRRLETLLAQAAPTRAVRVFNAGVMGYNTRQSEALRRRLEAALGYAFDAVIFQPCTNDDLDWDPALSNRAAFVAHMTGPRDTARAWFLDAAYTVLPYTTALLSHAARTHSINPRSVPLLMTDPACFLTGRNLAALTRLGRECRDEGRLLVIVTWPPHPGYQRVAAEYGAVFLGLESAPDEVYTNSPAEPHGNARFHQTVAEALARALRAHGLLAER